MVKKISLSVGLASILGLGFSACGGGGDGYIPSVHGELSSVSGYVSDGPIKNARVFVDMNANGTYDEGEPNDLTDEDGYYKIDGILDNGTEYLIIAEGSSELNTTDPDDNPNVDMNFTMFSSFTTSGTRTQTTIIGEDKVVNLNPTTFRNYLVALDDELYGALDTNDTNITAIINSTDIDNTLLFQSTILHNKTIFTNKLKEVAVLVEYENTASDATSSKSDISLSSSSNIVFSDKNSSTLSSSLLFQNKTIPVKVGDMVISKTLSPVTIQDSDVASEYKLFVTKYDQILQVPEYAQITDANYSMVSGYDITIKKDGINLANIAYDENNSTLKNLYDNVKSKVTTLNDENLTIFYYDQTAQKWDTNSSYTSDLNLTKLTPFVVAKKVTMQPKSINIADIATIDKASVVVSGIDADGKAVTIGVVDIGEDGNITLNIPEGYTITKAVVLSEELKDQTVDNKTSITYNVTDDGNATSTDASIRIPAGYLKDSIISGDLTQDAFGLDSLIDTKVLFNMLPVALENDINTTARDILVSNIQSYLSKESIFDDDNKTQISWENGSTEYIFNINKSTKKISLAVNDGNYTKDVVWSFYEDKVKRTYTHEYSDGVLNGTKYTSTYTYEGLDGNGTKVTFTDSENSVNKSETYTSKVVASYLGTAIFTRDINASMDKLLSATYTQRHYQTNTDSGDNTLDGLIKVINDGKFSFDGTFSMQTLGYGKVDGRAIIQDTNASTAQGNKKNGLYINNNTITDAVLLVKEEYEGIEPTFDINITGEYSGTITNSCEDNKTMTASVNQSTQTWGAVFTSAVYGDTIYIDGTNVRFKDDDITWSNATWDGANNIYGHWSSGSCSGDFNISKQVD